MVYGVGRNVASLLIAWSLFSRPDPDVAEGNKLYEQGEYAKAIEHYDKAKAKDEAQRHKLEFNRGTAQLKLGKFKDARQSLLQAEGAEDADLRARAAYNRGNAAMLMKELPASVQAYRQALRDKPDMQQALHNLDLALRMMRRPDAGHPDAGPPDAEQPEGGSPDGGSDGGDKNQADGGSAEGGQQNKSDGGQGGESGQQSGLDGGQGGDGQNSAGRDGGAQHEAGNHADAMPQPSSQKKQKEEKPKDISKQDALRMLDALRDSERDKMLMRFLQQEKSQQKKSVEKNW